MEPFHAAGIGCLMKTRSDSLTRLLAAATVVVFAALLLTPVAARTPMPDAAQGWQADPEPEEAFADAEFGVDPMVTGPTSAGFRERQARLRCLDAKWPNIPAACYPDFN
jgi:polyisoprenoid-binding protein YceI